MASDKGMLPAYLVVGTDELKRQRVLERLRARLDPSLVAFNLEEVRPTADMDPRTLVLSLNTMPVGEGQRRIVILSPADKLPKPLADTIATYLENPNPQSSLVLVADAMDKRTALYKRLAKLGKEAVISCEPKGRRELPGVVQNLARKYGMSVSYDAAQELVSRVGESALALDNQLRTLASMRGNTGEIALEDVEAHVARVAEVKPWDFLDRLSQRDLRRSLELYELLRQSILVKPSDSLIGLLTLVERRVRDLICAQSLDARGESRQLAEVLGRKDWQVRGYTQWARRFGPGELEYVLMACAQAERECKGGGDEDLALLRVISRMCGEPAGAKGV